MAFAELARIISDGGNGVRAFEKAAEEAFAMAVRTPDRAAPYFVLGSEAAGFVDLYERMPVTSAIAEAAQKRFHEHAARLDSVQGDPSGLLAALNEIASDILTGE